jgi:beta-barrel assembly-enhancing protease
MAKTLFEAIGYRLGKKAAQVKSAFDLMGGTEEESLRAEVRLGHDMAAALLVRTPLVQENERTQFAAQIGQWLASHVKERKLPFAVRVTAEREPNALALPGGPIFVSWPLLELCQWQRDEIAFVVGHELAHIVLRHTLDRIVKDAAFSLLLRQWSSGHAASAWLSQTGHTLLSRAFSRADELEADVFAEALVRTAGGDPLAGESVLEKLANLATGQSIVVVGAYFATHPALSDRIANLRAKRWG